MVISNKRIIGFGVTKSSLGANIRYLVVDLGKENISINSVSPIPIRILSAKEVGDFNSFL